MENCIKTDHSNRWSGLFLCPGVPLGEGAEGAPPFSRKTENFVDIFLKGATIREQKESKERTICENVFHDG